MRGGEVCFWLRLMNPSKFKIIDLDTKVMGTRYQHAVLIYEPKEQLLSYPAVWLSGQGGYKTGIEYAKVLQRFCNYLAEGPFSSDEEMLLSFWLYVTVDAIKAWKNYRIEKKYLERKVSPAFETIDREARIVCNFLDWVSFDKGVNTLWDGKRKTVIRARAIHNDFLRGIAGPQKREVVDVNTRVSVFPDNDDYPVEGLARKRQSKLHEYLPDQHMPILLNAFPDEVYKYICLTAYITGLRDFEVLAVPYWRLYEDGTEFTSDPDQIRARINKKLMSLKVLGKGKKMREVKVDVNSWFKIMESWSPLYLERKRKFENKTGLELPLNILWLDKLGDPIYCPPQDEREHYKPLRKLQDAFYYVNKGRKKNRLSARFGHSVDYYSLRHTYATNYILRVMEARRERERDKYIEDHSLRHDLANQLGNSNIVMTFSKYVDNAIVIIKDREAGKATYAFPNLEELLKEKHR